MKIIHTISLNVDKFIQIEFNKLGVDLDLGFTSFKIDESSENWMDIERLAHFYQAVDFAKTSFHKKELEAAKFLRMGTTWHSGYPEPAEDFGYLSETYDLSDFCSKCHSGLKQSRPFLISSEPKFGAKQISQLNWVFDEFFIVRDVWKKLFKPLGVNCLDVINSQTNKFLDSTVQLDIPKIEIMSDWNNYPSTTCKNCSKVKYEPIVKGLFPNFRVKNELPIFKTHELFGSGSNCHNAVFINQELYQMFKKHEIKGVEFTPVINAV
jgi:hypothetical protein